MGAADIEAQNKITRLLDEERRRWYRALLWAGNLTGLSPELAGEHVRRRMTTRASAKQRRDAMRAASIEIAANLGAELGLEGLLIEPLANLLVRFADEWAVLEPLSISAQETARSLHSEAIGDDDGYAPSGHTEPFETCNHADCVIANRDSI